MLNHPSRENENSYTFVCFAACDVLDASFDPENPLEDLVSVSNTTLPENASCCVRVGNLPTTLDQVMQILHILHCFAEMCT